MKVKTSEVSGAALAWLVAQCEGTDVRWSAPHEQLLIVGLPYSVWHPHKDWNQGGPIIEREGIATRQVSDKTWRADYSEAVLKHDNSAYAYLQQKGTTALIAAMRCYVASKLGDGVEVPDELMGGER